MKIWIFKDKKIEIEMRKWWIRVQCKASSGKAKVGGHKEPMAGEALFANNTYTVFEECIKHTGDVTDFLSA